MIAKTWRIHAVAAAAGLLGGLSGSLLLDHSALLLAEQARRDNQATRARVYESAEAREAMLTNYYRLLSRVHEIEAERDGCMCYHNTGPDDEAMD